MEHSSLKGTLILSKGILIIKMEHSYYQKGTHHGTLISKGLSATSDIPAKEPSICDCLLACLLDLLPTWESSNPIFPFLGSVHPGLAFPVEWTQQNGTLILYKNGILTKRNRIT